MKRLLELISKNKLLIVMLIIALAVGAVLQFAEEPFAWISVFNAEWRHVLGRSWQNNSKIEIWLTRFCPLMNFQRIERWEY
nr:hypothetical protein [Providencia sp. PROV195]